MRSMRYVLRCNTMISPFQDLWECSFENEICNPTEKNSLFCGKCNKSWYILNIFFYKSQDTPGQHNNLFLVQLVYDPENKFILADSATSC